MRKYLLTILLAIIVGFFLSYFFLRQYDDFNGIKVSNSGEELFFVQYGVFSTKDSMEENTINLQNYVYNEKDKMFYVYVGITKKEENANKITNYFKNNGYETVIKKYYISNKKFINELENYDEVLDKTKDSIAIASLINQILSKYEEVVLNGGKN